MKLRFLITGLCSILILFGCNSSEDTKFIEESGTIETNTIVLSSQTSGEVTFMFSGEGDFVESGDTLAVIDHEILNLKLRQAKAAKTIAESQLSLLQKGVRKEDLKQGQEALKQAQASYKLARDNKQRMDALLTEKSITQKQWEEVSTAYEIAQSRLHAAEQNLLKLEKIARPEEITQAEANLEKVKASVELINKNLSKCFIVSPISGQIVKSYVEKGELVSPMSSMFKVSDLSLAELYVYVSEINLGKVKLGQKAEVTVDSFPEKYFEGKVVFISPEAEFTPKNIQTKSERTKLVFAVKIELANPDFELKAGMPADARILVQ